MKVLLVDDNYQMLEFMNDCIPWSEKGLEVIGMCENGVEALGVAKESKPDIIITDIDMPNMDGLELLEEIGKLDSEIQALIISCHDDFQYAKKALKLLVNDYILKDTMEPETLEEAIDRVIEKITAKKRQQNDMTRWQKIVNQNRMSLKKEWLRSFIDCPISNEKEWITRSKDFHLHLDEKNYIPVIGCVQNIDCVLERFQSSDLLMYSMDNIAQEMKMEGFVYDNFEIIWFFPVTNSIKDNMYEDIRKFLVRLQNTLENYCGAKLAFMYSKPAATIHQLKQYTQQIIKMKHEWFYIEEKSVFSLENLNRNFSTDNIFSHYSKVVEEWKQLISDGDESEIGRNVSKWIQIIKDNKYHPETVKSWVNNILVTMQLNFNYIFKDEKSHTDVLHSEIHSLDAVHQVEKYICNSLREIITHVEAEGKSDRPEIWEVKKYVEKHIHEKITLERVAQHLFMNPSYFSRMFKKETNETFIEYVTRLKMKKAVDLLHNTNYTIEDISNQLGYENTSYFIKLFKKLNHLSPLEYRKAR
ncbi:response regulator [Evansella sp. AB-rgal1]|uniref:response regulator transcription factor n=1 Tax=Evansella sp. AB-rgal1 TaxID=3242696 RepID=UPI00359CE3AD